MKALLLSHTPVEEARDTPVDAAAILGANYSVDIPTYGKIFV